MFATLTCETNLLENFYNRSSHRLSCTKCTDCILLCTVDDEEWDQLVCVRSSLAGIWLAPISFRKQRRKLKSSKRKLIRWNPKYILKWRAWRLSVANKCFRRNTQSELTTRHADLNRQNVLLGDVLIASNVLGSLFRISIGNAFQAAGPTQMNAHESSSRRHGIWWLLHLVLSIERSQSRTGQRPGRRCSWTESAIDTIRWTVASTNKIHQRTQFENKYETELVADLAEFALEKRENRQLI